MLDDARNFRGMKNVKLFLDEMARVKMNVFHWHLTDDQGWRIETRAGASTSGNIRFLLR